MLSLQLHHLPFLTVSLLAFSVLVTTSIAYIKKHVTYILPYISDTGTFPPESCIFGQVLNMVALLLAFIMYIQFRKVELLIHKHGSENWVERLNRISIFWGLSATFGVTLVANFQETNVLWLHWLGAIMAFGGGAGYQCLMTTSSIKFHSIQANSRLNKIRMLLSAFSTVSFLFVLIPGLIALSQFHGKDVTKWKLEDGGFKMHNVSTFSEWICAFSTMGYILLYSNDFNSIKVYAPTVELIEDKNLEETSETV